jgi:DNA-binding transcriptional MerR regulator
MQRDEFLPLRVIRQELASGEFSGPRRGSEAAATRRAASVDAAVSTLTLEEILDEAGVPESLIRELQEFGIVQPDRRDGRTVFDETDLEIVRAAAELSRFGVAGRNLRVFRSSADREAALLQQIVGPALRSRSQARRKEAIENLESLAAVCGHLKHLMLVRDLRRIKGD